MMTRRDRIRPRLVQVVICVLLCSGCQEEQPYNYSTPTVEIQFSDDAKSNSPPSPQLTQLEFTNVKGEPFKLKEHFGKKNIVLVIVRGDAYPGVACPYCTTQVSRLIANYTEFTARATEVVVAFPTSKPNQAAGLKTLQDAVTKKLQQREFQAPFPVLLDGGLVAVTALGIKADLAKPSTFIFDKQGQVRFAYVGASIADRPSVKALLRELDTINK